MTDASDPRIEMTPTGFGLIKVKAAKKLDQRIASAEVDAQAKGRLLEKAERGKRALQADNRRLRGLLAMVTQERNDFAKQLGIEPEWTEADV